MLQALGDQIIFVTRPDKKKILFYNDKHCQFAVDEGMNCCCLDTNLYKLIQVFSVMLSLMPSIGTQTEGWL